MKTWLGSEISPKWRVAQWAEWRWWRWYLRKKVPADYLAQKTAYWYRFLHSCGISAEEAKSILDAGCGPAGIFMVCNNPIVCALDPLLPLYEKHLVHFDPKAWPGVDFIPIALEDWTPETKFELIFCLNAINHTRDLKLSLEKLRQVLHPEGKLILSTDTHKYDLLCRIFQWLPGDLLHPHQYGEAAYRNFLEEAGFSIERAFVSRKGKIFDYTVFVAY